MLANFGGDEARSRYVRKVAIDDKPKDNYFAKYGIFPKITHKHLYYSDFLHDVGPARHNDEVRNCFVR